MSSFSHFLHPDKQIRFVQPGASNLNELHLQALDLQSTSSHRGEEIQKFYKDLVNQPSSSNGMQKQGRLIDDEEIVILYETFSSPNLQNLHRERKLPLNRDSESRILLRAAAENKLEEVKNLCKNGNDIEVQDMFRWTPLLCAAAAGANQVIEVLLKNGANSGHQDFAGRTATCLALRNGHCTTAELIENFTAKKEELLTDQLSNSLEHTCDLNRVFCAACNCHYDDGANAQSVHESTMLHMINTGLLPQEGYSYGISAKSRGYQLLKKQGWTETKGLGKQGEGRKYPIKTALKRDTKGLGLDSKRVKQVTHYGPMDLRAVRGGGVQKQCVVSVKRRLILEKQKEAELRKMFED